MRISKSLHRASLIVTTAALTFFAAGADVHAGQAAQSLMTAGYKLRRETRLAANTVKRLDAHLQQTKKSAPQAAAALNAIHLQLVGSGGKGGLWFDLASADRDLETALKILSKYPDPCKGAKLGQWESIFAAERLMSKALLELKKVPVTADGIVRFDSQLAAIEQKLKAEKFSWTAMRARAALASYRKRHAADLGSVKKRIIKGLQDKGFAQLGKLGQLKGQCAPEGPATPLTPAPEGGVADGDDAYMKAPEMKAAAPPPAPAQAEEKKSFFGKLWDGVKKVAGKAVDAVKGIGEKAKGLWDRYKPIWLWKDKKDLSVHDNNLTWKKLDGELKIQGSGDANAIDPNDVNQGALGDCYYLSSMAAIARQDPGYIDNMIKKNDDGTYSVTYQEKRPWWKFWGPKYTPATVKVDNEFPVYNYGQPAFADFGDTADGKKEMWTMVGEKGYAQFAGQGPYLRIEGGFSNKSMAQITGVDSKSYSASKVTMDQLSEWDEKGYAMTIHTKNGALGGIFVNSDPLYKNNTIYPSHAYYIKEIDKEKGTVTLGNPWGYAHATLTMDQFQKSLHNVHINPIHQP